MVVCVHVGLEMRRLGYPSFAPTWPLAGVDIFFVISGFIMWVSTQRHPERGALDFMRNRIIRIVPLYWTLTAGMTVMMLVAPTLMQSARFDAVHVVKSFLFIAARHPALGFYWPVVVPGWTLNCEMFFYLLFAGAIAVGGQSEARRLALIATSLCACVAAVFLVPSLPPAIQFYGSPLLLEFLLGILIGWIFCRRCPPAGWYWWAVTGAGFILLVLLSTLPLVPLAKVGLPAGLIVAGAAFAKRITIPPLKRLGDASYSLYLSHGVALSALTQGWRAAGFSVDSPALFLVVALVVALLAGFATHHFVELPLTEWARRLLGRRPSPRAVAYEQPSA